MGSFRIIGAVIGLVFMIVGYFSCTDPPEAPKNPKKIIAPKCSVPAIIEFGEKCGPELYERDLNIINVGNVPFSGEVRWSTPYHDVVPTHCDTGYLISELALQILEGGGAYTLQPGGQHFVKVGFFAFFPGNAECELELGADCPSVLVTGTSTGTFCP